MPSKKSHNIPLYLVVSPLDDANTSEPVLYASASSYYAILDAHGIPSEIVWCKTVSIAEYLER